MAQCCDDDQYATIDRKLNPALDNNRPLRLTRPCPCGCDTRVAGRGVGYISGADGKGAFFSLWIREEQVYQAVSRVFRKHGLTAEK